jgi:hypothetical protein
VSGQICDKHQLNFKNLPEFGMSGELEMLSSCLQM